MRHDGYAGLILTEWQPVPKARQVTAL